MQRKEHQREYDYGTVIRTPLASLLPLPMPLYQGARMLDALAHLRSS